MLYAIVIVLHVIACIVLIATILLQAGRGGGLSEAFGGTSTQTIFGTKTNVFLTRATTVCAIMYLITCLFLGIMTSRRGRSLLQLRGPIPQTQRIPITQPLEEGKEKDVLGEAKQSWPPAEPEPLPKE